LATGTISNLLSFRWPDKVTQAIKTFVLIAYSI
jgi:hypothetical protein